MTMSFGIFLPVGFGQEFAGTGPAEAADIVVELAGTAEDTGFKAAWLPDHLLTIPPSTAFVLESWAMLAALARETDRIGIGPLVTATGYRNPALQAKIASTVNGLSRGRLTFGIGAGWYEPDYRAFGYDFPEAPERLRQLREAVRTIRDSWSHQQAHIPTMIAGGGEKVTLKIVAEYADACNVMTSPTDAGRKFAVLRQHCADSNSDYDSILRTVTTGCLISDTDDEAQAALSPAAGAFYPGDFRSYLLYGTVDTVRRRIDAFREAGVQQLIVSFHDATEPEAVRRFAKEFID
ncbi:LLM class flavin-dependent oxidoreductase [Jiangella asiatica]|uniref:LLM class flavin-dependent oxidoreductase n=1 Tax=Jiangella asiatica TaxID=2530372 RepID=A0A4R5CCR4_9ACTN|nr:LLM class flavin-dependent oxidoreductase [Jiangella asiatica]TDD97255.1 LLM class flavin-dependent oxidoreductase [Jiangella asiatica]